MHGLETIVAMNAAPVKPALTTVDTPCEADELKDIEKLVTQLRSPDLVTVGHGYMDHMVRMSKDEGNRVADYLVAAYGIQED